MPCPLSRPRPSSVFTAWVLPAGGLAPVVHGQTAAYTIMDLDLRVGINSAAYGINNPVQVVGYLSNSASTAGRATLCGGPNFIPTTLDTMSGVSSEVFAINAAGLIAGRVIHPTTSQTRVEHFARQESGGWLYHEHHEGADRLRLSSIEIELTLAEIYEQVTFPEAGTGR